MNGPRAKLPNPESSLAIVVPTIGRPSLAFLLSALAEQTATTDRVLVVCDRIGELL